MPKICLRGSIGTKGLRMGDQTKYPDLDMRNFGVFMQNPLENGSDDAPEGA